MISNIKETLEFVSRQNKDDYFKIQVLGRKEKGDGDFVPKEYFVCAKDFPRSFVSAVNLSLEKKGRVYVSANSVTKKDFWFSISNTALNAFGEKLNIEPHEINRYAFKNAKTKTRYWMLDIDRFNPFSDSMYNLSWEIMQEKMPFTSVHFCVPTKNGYHVICEGFNPQSSDYLNLVEDFEQKGMEITIKGKGKENPFFLAYIGH